MITDLRAIKKPAFIDFLHSVQFSAGRLQAVGEMESSLRYSLLVIAIAVATVEAGVVGVRGHLISTGEGFNFAAPELAMMTNCGR